MRIRQRSDAPGADFKKNLAGARHRNGDSLNLKVDMLRKLFFDLQYRFTKPRWDSGVTPPELVALIEAGGAAGRALDLGCGTGTNSIYLAEHGMEVVGVDFSPTAITTARAKARQRGLAITFQVADVTRVDVSGPFDLVLDIGCFHSLDEAGRARYAANLRRLTRPGSTFMLSAFDLRQAAGGPRMQMRRVGISPAVTKEVLGAHFELQRMEHGSDRGDRVSTWYWFKRIQVAGESAMEHSGTASQKSLDRVKPKGPSIRTFYVTPHK
ncbi:MAG: class I SAM-dependent methyltransferase, partial [Chloroflexi bacterium]|nr:class I SAM-dependent methyltransferase [Chloroflexota bacterium]